MSKFESLKSLIQDKIDELSYWKPSTPRTTNDVQRNLRWCQEWTDCKKACDELFVIAKNPDEMDEAGRIWTALCSLQDN
jgi:hypothetical protein